MSSPLQQTTEVDVDAVSEVTVEESQAPAGAAGSPLPAVGTNAKSEWAMWDPNLWWTDWALPPDPRPSWEQWFEWVNQLQALTPALGQASQDWQTMIGQFDDSLRAVRAMRSDLAAWSGPSAQTMSDALDRLEESITTKAAAIQNNPARLDQLAQSISDAVPPMAALDAEYQQVLQDLNACRQVAERGKPIMLNLATELLQVGTDLENSVRTDNLAPQPVPPQPLALSEGPQGPTNQLQQVAGSAGLADPGAVAPGALTAVSDQPTTAGVSGIADPGVVQSAQQGATANIPGVAVGGGGTDAVVPTAAADPTLASASPTLAGVGGGAAAPTMAPPVGGVPAAAPAMAPSGPMMPMGQFSPTPVTPAMAGGHATPVAPVPMVAPPARKREDEKPAASVVRVPVPLAADTVTGAAAVPAGLRGRTGEQQQPVVSTAAVRRGVTEPRKRADENEAFTVEDAGTGTVTAPR
jgi:hypothetical protein